MTETNIDTENISKEFGSCRFITVLTPNTFMKKMIMISTVFSVIEKSGETAIKQVEALSGIHIDDYNTGFTTLKKHTTLEDAMKFHTETVNSKGFIDCEE